MARSSSVRRWLEELRFETESYDPQIQETASTTVTCRYAKVTWTSENAVTLTTKLKQEHFNSDKQSLRSMEMLPNQLETLTNNIITEHEGSEFILDDTKECIQEQPEVIRSRFATISIPPKTVSNNVKKIQNTFSQYQQKVNHEEPILRRPKHLQIPSISVPQRPHSHQHLKHSSYLYKEQNPTLSVIREGPINRAKLNVNKSPKHWKTGMHALLTDCALFFFDDGNALLAMKSGITSGGITAKDRIVDLQNGARIVQDTDRLFSTKRNVLVIYSRDGQITALMQNDDQQLSDNWFKDISKVIAKHAKGEDDTEGTPTSGGVTNTKSVLNWFFKKRPNKETLVNQGIYKNEPIFGNTLERLYEASDKKRLVPSFVVRCTELLENEPHVLSIGLYRTSGNLSHIQKLRLRVDQEDAEALEDSNLICDSDVLAGALKLFFRELQVPLVPYQIYIQLSDACTNSDSDKRFVLIKEALKKLSEPHYSTLMLLCKHLLNITMYERQNQMSAANLGIVWGPSFTWPDEGTGTRDLHLCTDINRVVQYLIEESNKIFIP